MQNQIIKKLEAHDQQLETIAKTLVNVEGKIGSMEGKITNLQRTVVNMEGQIGTIKETMATKTDISNIYNSLDFLTGLAKKKDHELIFMNQRISRVEDDVKHLKTLSA